MYSQPVSFYPCLGTCTQSHYEGCLSRDECIVTIACDGVCPLMIVAKAVVKLFPSPVAVAATLRLLADKVSSLFGRAIPYAVPIWTAFSFAHIATLLILSSVIVLCWPADELNNFFPYELVSSIATIANAILLVAGTDTALLAHTCAIVGQLSSWKSFLLDLRNASFLASFFLAAKNFSDVPLAVVRNLLNAGVIFLSARAGYTTTIGALSALSCALGPVQILCNSYGWSRGGDQFCFS
jgi:hypothetical protein